MTDTQTPILVALGGNAISPADQQGNIPEQFATACQTAQRLAELVEHGHHIIVTHGNGPQVGNVLRRVELAAHEVYRLPLHICVADTQAGMGYMITECLNNEFHRRGLGRTASTIITAVEVDPHDAAFARPSKPIGSVYDAEHARRLREQYGWDLVEIRSGAFRRVVPSPAPQRVLEIDLIRTLAQAGETLVVGGGGGIPCARDKAGLLSGVEAVIDKDRTSGLIAAQIGVPSFVIATGVERVALRFGTADETPLDRMTVAEARSHLQAGEFPPGSMGPKIEAAVDFLERTRSAEARVIICALEHLLDAVNGKSGTLIVP